MLKSLHSHVRRMLKNGQNAYADSGLAGLTVSSTQKPVKRPEKVVAVDFHGTISDKGKLIEPMKAKMNDLKRQGFKIIVYSAGFNNNPQAVQGIETFLQENQVPYDEVWQRTGKPDADCYIDDKSWNPTDKDIKDLGVTPEGKIVDLTDTNKESFK